MLDHVTIRVSDRGARGEPALPGKRRGGALAHLTEDRPRHAVSRPGRRSLLRARRGKPPATEHVHLAFPVATDEPVAEFHGAATSAGYRDNGAPGERPQYHEGYVGAFVLDPDGTNVEAVNHNR